MILPRNTAITLLCLCCCFYSKATIAQDGTALKYYDLINQAELAICDSNTKSGYGFYEKAFKCNPQKPFSNDLYNAFHCAMDAHYFHNAGLYLSKLLSRGVNEKFIQEYIVAPYNGTMLDTVNGFLNRFHNDTVHASPMVAKINAMIQTDQKIRQYFSMQNNGSYMNDSVAKVDSLNAQGLYTMFNAFGGIPNEDVTGSLQNFPWQGPLFNILLIHHQGFVEHNKVFNLFDTMLYKAIFSFDYSPTHFVTLWSSYAYRYKDQAFHFNNLTIQFPLSISVFLNMDEEDKAYLQYYSPEQERKMDKERKKMGLETLEELRRKFLFSKKQEKIKSVYQKYNIGQGITHYIDGTNENLKEWLNSNQIYKPK